jgi:cytochrome b pre-mRNA-processing protein 3
LSFLSRLLGTQSDPREQVRPLWHRVVELSREPALYAAHGVADTVDGRFDMIVHVLSLAMLRMEASPDLAPMTARLTELFVEDMDGQLRESGVGDVVVGKHVGKLMGALGGRIGALRRVLAADDPERDDAALAELLTRNVHWSDTPDPAGLAAALKALAVDFAGHSDEDVLAGRIG